jgi:putative membrane protein
MLQPSLQKNDSKAKTIIWIVSIIVFAVVAALSRIKLNVSLPFNAHIFATINAVLNSLVTLLLLAGLLLAKSGKYVTHKKVMITALVLSVLFLVSYIAHHLFAGETRYGDLDHDGILSLNETAQAGATKYVYYILLALHIPLAVIILPIVLFTAYRALIGEYEKHKKMVRIAWPLWFFVAVSGVAVYLMISPYYN